MIDCKRLTSCFTHLTAAVFYNIKTGLSPSTDARELFTEIAAIRVYCESEKRVSYIAIVHTAKWSRDEYCDGGATATLGAVNGYAAAVNREYFRR